MAKASGGSRASQTRKTANADRISTSATRRCRYQQLARMLFAVHHHGQSKQPAVTRSIRRKTRDTFIVARNGPAAMPRELQKRGYTNDTDENREYLQKQIPPMQNGRRSLPLRTRIGKSFSLPPIPRVKFFARRGSRIGLGLTRGLARRRHACALVSVLPCAVLPMPGFHTLEDNSCRCCIRRSRSVPTRSRTVL